MPWLSAEYQINEFRGIIRNTDLNSWGLHLLTTRKMSSYPQGLNGSYWYVTSPESRNIIICKKINVCINFSTTFATAWIVSSTTMDLTTLHVIYHAVASSIVCLSTNLDVGMASRHIFRRISLASWWSSLILTASWRTHVANVPLTSSYWPITWSNGV